MRVLYLGFNRSYTNPSAEVNIRIIGQISELDYFGPGFTEQSVLLKGVDEWVMDKGPYDFLMVDSYVFEADNILNRRKPFIGDYLRFDPKDYYEHSINYMNFFLEYTGRKLFLANFDTFGISEKLIERVVTSNAYVLEGGNSVVRTKEVIEEEYGAPYPPGNDNWYNYVSTYRHQVIAVPHSISSTEFDFSPLSDREKLYCVIGAPYGERKEAMKLMTFKQRNTDFGNRLKAWLRAKYMKAMTEIQLLRLRSDYMSIISDTKLCFCSGGPWLYPVRKYFEIPARGAVAIGWSCSGFKALGFEDGKNYIVANKNEDLKKAIARYNDSEFQVIAENGRSMIWRLHSDWARSKQLEQSLNLILEGRFKGSYWDEGQYKHYD